MVHMVLLNKVSFVGIIIGTLIPKSIFKIAFSAFAKSNFIPEFFLSTFFTYSIYLLHISSLLPLSVHLSLNLQRQNLLNELPLSLTLQFYFQTVEDILHEQQEVHLIQLLLHYHSVLMDL